MVTEPHWTIVALAVQQDELPVEIFVTALKKECDQSVLAVAILNSIKI